MAIEVNEPVTFRKGVRFDYPMNAKSDVSIDDDYLQTPNSFLVRGKTLEEIIDSRIPPPSGSSDPAYIAKITQIGEGAPSETVFRNTIPNVGSTWSREGVGFYKLILEESTITDSNTIVFLQTGQAPAGSIIRAWIESNYILIETYMDKGGGLALIDDVLTGTYIWIVSGF